MGVTFKEGEGDCICFRTAVQTDVILRGKGHRDYEEDMVTPWFTVAFSGILHNGLSNVRILGVDDYSRERFDKEDALTKYLVPYVYAKDLDEHATRFLEKYCPRALKTAMPLPLNEILEAMQLKRFEAPLPDNIFGQTFFSPAHVQIIDERTREIVEMDIEPGTILINPNVVFMRNIGSNNNTIIHECVHWDKHHKFFALQQLLNPGISTITCAKEYFEDLDGDGNPPDVLKNVQYSECTTTFHPLIAAEVGFKKAVKASDELHYSANSQVTAAGTYTYQLRFANSRDVNTGNVVMYDVLESAHGSNPYWKGSLQSINTSQPQMKGVAPLIYYSTYPGFTNLTVDGHQADLTDTTIWSTTAPANLADVTAIAIDLRHKADGTEYVFAPEEVALCYVTMTAPENYQDYVDNPMTDADETVYAYNSAYLQCTTTLVNGGASSTAVEECAPVTVSMRSPEIEIHKSSDPQSGTEAQPTAVNVGDTITYHISVKNKGTAEAIYNLSIEDVIPEGLSIQRDQLQYCFGSTAASPVTINGASRISAQQDGQKLVFSLDKLDAGETVHLLIPVTVSEGANNGMSFVNTAKLTAFNGKTWDIESETTYHKTESDFGYELPATGGNGTLPIMLCGIAIMIGCGFWFAVRQKKKRKSY